MNGKNLLKETIVEALREWLAKVEEEENRQDRLAAAEARRNFEPGMSLEDYGKRRGWHAV